ncbi:hypothetical protein [Flagellimonas meridianipacifica]|uniref:Uncharacterized protein n=1 Tax=Flagellimonas meridianipacifica TaxID=1080225 RepID=A0A2T0MB70_9FLAO|nr:hypothetical protein [Allomuricauda pacifica]PRX54715.1 hypothetical protein CLV81_3119 [Allomuricauda pacifica]
MKIKYCRKRLGLSLFFGFSWIILAVVYHNTSVHGSSHLTILAFVIALLYFINFLHKVFIPYYVIKNGVFQKKYPSKLSLSIAHVDMVRETKNSIFLHGSLCTLEIVKYKLDKNSLDDLRNYLKTHLGNFDSPKNLKNNNSTTKIRNICLFFMAVSFGVSAQKKIKPIKNPVSWSYTIAPKTPLSQNISTYDILVDSNLSPMDWWDEISWNAKSKEGDLQERDRLFQEAISDTLDTWAKKYMEFNQSPYSRTNQNPDITITLKTLYYKIENLQSDIDFSDKESIICQIDATASLTVVTRYKDTLLSYPITFYVDEKEKSTSLPIGHFLQNPIFKMKYNLKKNPQKKLKLLGKKLVKYEADVLEFFYKKSGEILREHFLKQNKTVYSAIFGIKNKGHEALNDACYSAKTAINTLSAGSKKKKRNHQEIKPEIEICLNYWQDKLDRTSNPEIQKIIFANLSLGHLLMDNLEESKKYLSQIAEFENLPNRILLHEEFNYYLIGLAEAIETKERYGELAQIQ